MEAMEIMTNDEVIKTTEEIMKTVPSKGHKIAAGIVLAVLASGVAYKYVVKPISAIIKTRKARKMIHVIDNNQVEDDVEPKED